MNTTINQTKLWEHPDGKDQMILTILIKEKENPCDDPTKNKNWFLTEFFNIQVWGHKFQQLNKAIYNML